jgi:tight adherence protein C
MTLPLLLSVVMFGLLMAGITVFGYRRYARPGKIYARLGQAAAVVMPELSADKEDKPNAATQLLQRVGEYMPVSPGDASLTRRLLIMGGFRGENAVAVFYGLKVVGAVVMLLVALALRDGFSNPAFKIVMVIAGGAAGYFGPGFLLEKRISARQKTLRLSLPDALDLMVVSVEAGLGLDQAILHVSSELKMSHPEICEEWSLVNLEMRAGKRRSDALRNMAERTGEPDIAKLVAILVQNDRFGTSMAESLRQHSDFMRTRRRQEAEERAGKVGVKLVFPIFFFILPSMMIVTAGPAMLQIVKELIPLMSSAGNS